MNIKKGLCLAFSISIFTFLHADYTAVISIPKCGTHLTLKIIESLTHIKHHIGPRGWCLLDKITIQKVIRNNLLLKTHAIYIADNINLLSRKDFKKVFIYRDPRDQVVSAAYWVKKRPGRSQQTISQLIDELITGGGKIWSKMFFAKADTVWQHLQGITDFYNLYLPWQYDPTIYTTQFEKIIGSRGGGDAETQLQEIMNIARHIGKEITKDEAQTIADTLFGGTITFREGKIGSWKKHFSEHQKELFKKVAGQLLIDLGYEKDLNW